MPTTSDLLEAMHAGIQRRQAEEQARRQQRIERYAQAASRRAQAIYLQGRRVIRRGDPKHLGVPA
jgi:hypothetical protein